MRWVMNGSGMRSKPCVADASGPGKWASRGKVVSDPTFRLKPDYNLFNPISLK